MAGRERAREMDGSAQASEQRRWTRGKRKWGGREETQAPEHHEQQPEEPLSLKGTQSEGNMRTERQIKKKTESEVLLTTKK